MVVSRCAWGVAQNAQLIVPESQEEHQARRLRLQKLPPNWQ